MFVTCPRLHWSCDLSTPDWYSCRKQFACRPEDRGLRNILQLFVWATGFKLFTKHVGWPFSGALRTSWPNSNWNCGLSTLPSTCPIFMGMQNSRRVTTPCWWCATAHSQPKVWCTGSLEVATATTQTHLRNQPRVTSMCSLSGRIVFLPADNVALWTAKVWEFGSS